MHNCIIPLDPTAPTQHPIQPGRWGHYPTHPAPFGGVAVGVGT
jgi:hypothetical protein